jgi:hypothetical protein
MCCFLLKIIIAFILMAILAGLMCVSIIMGQYNRMPNKNSEKDTQNL